MAKMIIVLRLLVVPLSCVAIQVQAQEQPAQEQPVQEQPVQEQPRKAVFGGAVGVKCLAPGNRESVVYDYNSPDDANKELIKVVDNVMVGSDWGFSPRGNDHRCMGRCGFNCSGHPIISRMYTQDCLVHDVCSREQNADGGSDPNCGDEFREAIGDTFFSLFNICKYNRGDHRRAARGKFVQ